VAYFSGVTSGRPISERKLLGIVVAVLLYRLDGLPVTQP